MNANEIGAIQRTLHTTTQWLKDLSQSDPPRSARCPRSARVSDPAETTGSVRDRPQRYG